MRVTEKMRQRTLALYDYDAQYYMQGYTRLAGMDEVGRGPLAGPVVVACVVLPKDSCIPGVDDSKKVSEKRREELYDVIVEQAVCFKVSSVGAEVIDEINILQATRRAFEDAATLRPVPDFFLLDALQGLRLPVPSCSPVHGDSISYRIAAASILAKVTRDRMMRAAHEEYPQYGFDRHKGYGTQQHIQALREYGPCPLHRRCFLTKILG